MNSIALFGNDDLFEESEQAAKRASFEWIRAALREAFLQALKQVWVISSNTEEIDDDYTIEVSEEGFQQCMSFVEHVANGWTTKLRGVQHDCVAGWVEEVLSKGKSRLWADLLPSSQHEQSPSFEAPAPDADSIGLSVSEADKDQGISSPETIIPYCNLRRLERKTHLEEKLPENPLAIFQEMGRRGESHWPLDWKLIEVAANREKQKRKSTFPTTDAQHAPPVDNPGMLPPAKRRKGEDSIGRPPADLSSMSASSESLSIAEKKMVSDQFIHPDPSEATKPPPQALFGALQKVSKINYSKRYRDDWTARKNRLERNAATSERLFPNKIESNDSVRSYRSKVLKTRDRNDNCIHCFDLDMGWSLMEVTTPLGENQKRLCAFSSLEIRLHDEDDAPREENT